MSFYANTTYKSKEQVNVQDATPNIFPPMTPFGLYEAHEIIQVHPVLNHAMFVDSRWSI